MIKPGSYLIVSGDGYLLRMREDGRVFAGGVTPGPRTQFFFAPHSDGAVTVQDFEGHPLGIDHPPRNLSRVPFTYAAWVSVEWPNGSVSFFDEDEGHWYAQHGGGVGEPVLVERSEPQHRSKFHLIPWSERDTYRPPGTGGGAGPGTWPGVRPAPSLSSGDWRGNFLFPFFGPAMFADPVKFRSMLTAHREVGHTDVLLNASQDGWMIREGHPEWGDPFKWWQRNTLDIVMDRCREALASGLRPHLSVFDQPDLREIWFVDQLAMLEDFVRGVRDVAAVINYSWEIDEVWLDRVLMEDRLVQAANTVHRIDTNLGFAIHHRDGLRGGFNFYGQCPPNTIRYMQNSTEASPSTLRHEAALAGEVAARTHTQCCAMEHSSPVRVGPNYIESDANARAKVAYDELRQWLPASRTGSMNGDPR